MSLNVNPTFRDLEEEEKVQKIQRRKTSEEGKNQQDENTFLCYILASQEKEPCLSIYSL